MELFKSSAAVRREEIKKSRSRSPTNAKLKNKKSPINIRKVETPDSQINF
jgi:hypothetical protein